MDGIIQTVYQKRRKGSGYSTNGGTEIMRVADMSKMKVDVEVGENDIQK
ncbi:MAG: hypothetical protein IPI46_14685 [Bacteroidetes bacterium]|nr:hypothetical protein [Bacteroidota bacterium]